MPRDKSVRKILVIGSGPIVIGQAAEFDYAGTQALRVLREEGIESVLINSNPATIMTDTAVADRIYIEPLTLTTVKRVIETAVGFADETGYPVIVHPAFTLGGSGGGIAEDEPRLREIAAGGLASSPIGQILVEKSVAGWKEIEFEVLRDSAGNVITVCSMENFDPVGIHTGDSIVIAPAVTLADREYQMLRTAALDIITALGVEGGCNCQFALDPHSFDYARKNKTVGGQ